MTIAKFHREILRKESRLAPGSETNLYGHFVAHMYMLGGRDWRDSKAKVPAADVAWWRRVYELYEAERSKPLADQVTDVQAIFDRV